ncbi:MAG: c-type cytochrome [Candidatus Acidiferrales bacterium]
MAVAAVWLGGCSRFGHRAPGELSEQEMQGKQLYDTHCSQCHEATEIQLPAKPPKLDGLFHKPTLPSGAPATDDQVRKTIGEGRGIMPPFGAALKSDYVDAIVAYLHTR